MKYLIALLLLATPAFAEKDYVVSGEEVQKITRVTRTEERDVLKAELIQINAQIQSYKDNIDIQKAELAKAQALKQSIQDKIILVDVPVVVPEIIVDSEIYEINVDSAIYIDSRIY